MIPDSLRMATLFPLAAMRVNRPAEPFICVPIVENVSLCWQNAVSKSLLVKSPIQKTPSPYPKPL